MVSNALTTKDLEFVLVEGSHSLQFETGDDFESANKYGTLNIPKWNRSWDAPRGVYSGNNSWSLLTMKPNSCSPYTVTTNNLLNGEVAGVSSPSDANVICTFLPGFNGSARCTVQYGTDPTYMNLPYSAESTETGTAGDSVSVVLMERLNSSTVYYYTVCAVSGDISVTVRAPPFITPEYSKQLTKCTCLHDTAIKTCIL